MCSWILVVNKPLLDVWGFLFIKGTSVKTHRLCWTWRSSHYQPRWSQEQIPRRVFNIQGSISETLKMQVLAFIFLVILKSKNCVFIYTRVTSGLASLLLIYSASRFTAIFKTTQMTPNNDPLQRVVIVSPILSHISDGNTSGQSLAFMPNTWVGQV